VGELMGFAKSIPTTINYLLNITQHGRFKWSYVIRNGRAEQDSMVHEDISKVKGVVSM
jgi:hypothetical protein